MPGLDYVQVDRGVIVERHLVLVDDAFQAPVVSVSLRDRVAVWVCVSPLIAYLGFLGWAVS